VVVGHVLAGIALFQLLDRVRPPVPPPITVFLDPAPPPAEAPAEIAPEPLPQAPEPVRPARREPPKVAVAPPPLLQPEPPAVLPEPAPEPEPLPPVRQVEPLPEPLPAPPIPAPTARVEQPPVTMPPPEPVRPAPPRAPVATAPPPPAVPADPVTEPLYGADYLRNPKPTYPLMSRRMGEQGVVLLRVFVTADGDPREIVLKEGSGHARLDRAAQEVVQRWKFVPAKRGSRPVDAWVVVPIRFSLKG
jgi:periplasmic protein TonB